MGVGRWVLLGVFSAAILSTGRARAQDCVPACRAGYVCEAGTCVAAPAAAPAEPEAAPASPAPAAEPAPAPTPAPTAPPPAAAPGVSTTGVGGAQTDGSFEDGSSPPPAAFAFTPGLYLGGALGYGAPMGASTYPGDDDWSIGGGVGAMAFGGYQFSKNFGLGGFFHYNQVSTQFVESEDEPDEISAFALFYGVEFRAGFMSDVVDGWASAGLATGYGQIKVKNSESDEFGTFSVEETDELNFGIMPTLAFGAEAKVSSKVSIGPLFRLYITTVKEACYDQTVTFDGNSQSDDDCTSDTAEVIVPNVGFAGIALTVRP